MLKPQATPTRELVNLDGTWRFAIDSRAGDAPWSGRLDTPLEAAVPASYNDLFVDPAVRDHVGWVYYQRSVRVPRGWGEDRVLLRFDAATHAARVYVDDTLVGEHVGGYTPFDVDVTGVAAAGGEFRLTVAVSNELTSTTIPPGKIEVSQDGTRKQTYFHDFYNYAGLARSVWLYSVPRERVTDITVTTGFEWSTGLVDYRVEAEGAGDVRVRLADAQGGLVAEGTGAAGRLTRTSTT
jgi:beta-glucuronidase